MPKLSVIKKAIDKAIERKNAISLGVASGAVMASDESEAAFIGRLAKTFDIKALNKAKEMKIQGASRDEIWRQTGEEFGKPTYLDVDGHWKQEIDDSKAKSRNVLDTVKDAKNQLDKYDEVESSLGQAYTHPDLRRAYPDMSKDMVVVQKPYSYSDGAYYKEISDEIFVPSDYTIGSSKALADRDSLSHEAQHGIQGREGFGRGGSPDEMAQEYNKNLHNINYFQQKKTDELLKLRENPDYNANESAIKKATSSDNLNKDLLTSLLDKRREFQREATGDISREIIALEQKNKLNPFEQYQRLSGEAEARNVQTRLDMPMGERVKKTPWSTLDVPEDELIVRGQSKGASYSSENRALYNFANKRAQKGSPRALDALAGKLRGYEGVAKTIGSGLLNEAQAGLFGITASLDPTTTVTGSQMINQVQQDAPLQYMPKTQEEMDALQGVSNVIDDTVDYWGSGKSGENINQALENFKYSQDYLNRQGSKISPEVGAGLATALGLLPEVL